MSTTTQTATETAGAMVAKAAPPASISLATLAGIQVSELVLWATLIYTTLMIAHKLLTMWREFKGDEQ
jgi:hypothetical protein